MIASGVLQFVGGAGCESLLFGAVCFELREHGVEGVGELAELVTAARQLDSVRERTVRGHAGGVGDASQGAEHAAGQKPPSQETECQQERQHDGRGRTESADHDAQRHQDVAVDHQALGRQATGGTVGAVSQKEHPHGGEQQATCEH